MNKEILKKEFNYFAKVKISSYFQFIKMILLVFASQDLNKPEVRGIYA